MAIKNIIEKPRSGTHRFGESPQFIREFVVQTSDASHPFAQLVSLCGITHGSSHPEFVYAKVVNVEASEALDEQEDPSGTDTVQEQPGLLVTLKATYEVPQKDSADNPLDRPDIWKFMTQGVAVPALYYYDNTTLKPLTNSAGDYFEGLTVDEGQQKITITGNRAAFPSASAAAVTNCLNQSAYLGFSQDCVKVQGISGEQVLEVVNNTPLYYWKVTVELLARQTGWNLLIPDIGFNFIDGGVKKRAYVIGPEGDQIASANPVALNGSGALVAGGGLPSVLTRRVYKRIDFTTYFGTPPT